MKLTREGREALWSLAQLAQQKFAPVVSLAEKLMRASGSQDLLRYEPAQRCDKVPRETANLDRHDVVITNLYFKNACSFRNTRWCDVKKRVMRRWKDIQTYVFSSSSPSPPSSLTSFSCILHPPALRARSPPRSPTHLLSFPSPTPPADLMFSHYFEIKASSDLELQL
eukprot:753165-Hanusia_phi.AAC.3